MKKSSRKKIVQRTIRDSEDALEILEAFIRCYAPFYAAVRSNNLKKIDSETLRFFQYVQKMSSELYRDRFELQIVKNHFESLLDVYKDILKIILKDKIFDHKSQEKLIQEKVLKPYESYCWAFDEIPLKFEDASRRDISKLILKEEEASAFKKRGHASIKQIALKKMTSFCLNAPYGSESSYNHGKTKFIFGNSDLSEIPKACGEIEETIRGELLRVKDFFTFS